LFDGGKKQKNIYREMLIKEAVITKGVGVIIVSLLQNDTTASSP
jgi:hypothetical protein